MDWYQRKAILATALMFCLSLTLAHGLKAMPVWLLFLLMLVVDCITDSMSEVD